MASSDALLCVHLPLKDIIKNDKLFGGKKLLLGGGVRQTLPAVPYRRLAAIVDANI